MNKTIQIKRNKPSGSQYRVLYAKTGRKRRLHAATATADDPHAGLGSDVPNIGIGRALLVILILHVLAIAAIYIHSAFFGDADDTTANKGQDPSSAKPVAAAVVVANAGKKPEPVAAAVEEPSPDPVLAAAASARYIVVTGDSYKRIAEVRNVDERALRALNSNRPIRAGVVLDLPVELSTRPVDPKPVAMVKQKVVQRPAAGSSEVDRADHKMKIKSVEAKSQRAAEAQSDYDVSDAPKAMVVKPNKPAPAVGANSDVQDSGQRYTIKSGDTLWRISNRFKISRDTLLKLNGIEDPNKLYAGRTIKIPTK